MEARSLQKGASKSLQLSLAEAYSKMGEAQEHAFYEELIYNGGFSGEDELRVMFSYLTYVLMQDVDVMKNVPEVMQHYQENGGSLVKHSLNQTIIFLL